MDERILLVLDAMLNGETDGFFVVVVGGSVGGGGLSVVSTDVNVVSSAVGVVGIGVVVGTTNRQQMKLALGLNAWLNPSQ